MGFYMGKFIYLMDAYEDYDRDKKKNCYNPLTFVQEEQAQDLDTWCPAFDKYDVRVCEIV